MVSTGTVQPCECEKHGLSVAVIEDVFKGLLAILPDAMHSQQENRFSAIGRTNKGRGIFVIFTFRRKGEELLIRPISALYMHKKEFDAFEKENFSL
jgi:uncharacterized DUF497 family protein